MEIFDSIEAVFQKYPGARESHYVSREQMGECMLCHEHKDLRCGACFQCADNVSGKKIKGGHRLWQTDKPDNMWYLGNQPGEKG